MSIAIYARARGNQCATLAHKVDLPKGHPPVRSATMVSILSPSVHVAQAKKFIVSPSWSQHKFFEAKKPPHAFALQFLIIEEIHGV